MVFRRKVKGSLGVGPRRLTFSGPKALGAPFKGCLTPKRLPPTPHRLMHLGGTRTPHCPREEEDNYRGSVR